MRNLQILLWALIAAAYTIARVLLPDVPLWATLLPAILLGIIVAVIFQYLRRRQNIQEYTLEETGVIGLGLGGSGKSKSNK